MGKTKSTGGAAGVESTPGGDRAPVVVEALPPGRRAAVLLHHLQLIEKSVVAHEDTGRYSVLPVAIEGWLRTAIASAEQLLEELTAAPAPRKKAPARKKAKRSARAGAGARVRSSRPGASRPAPGDDPYPGGEHGGVD